MSIRTAETTWTGTLREGKGNMAVGSGAFDVPFSFGTRFADEPGTNPEELIGAAQAGCFSMFLAAQLTAAGFPPTRITTQAEVHFGRDDIGPVIEKIVLNTEAEVLNVDQDKFDELVAVSKEKCPISRALAAIKEYEVHASLVG
ncbi:MAG: OsmC family peroxiredoxin [Anaerolineales bacterium]|nr:OsmC family peroxiredoxin [Anaerolineales bacterium]